MNRGFESDGQHCVALEHRQVVQRFSKAHAEELVASAEQQLGAPAVQSWLPKHELDGEEDWRSLIVEALVLGRLSLVRHARSRPTMVSPEVHDLVDLIESEELEDEPPPTLDVTCIGPEGQTYAFSSCRVLLPDGTEELHRLDHQSRLRINNARSEGACQFELASDARPDGGIRDAPGPRATVIQLGVGATLHTSEVHIVRVLPAENRIEFVVVDTHGRSVPHFQARLLGHNSGTPVAKRDDTLVAEELTEVGPVSVAVFSEKEGR